MTKKKTRYLMLLLPLTMAGCSTDIPLPAAEEARVIRLDTYTQQQSATRADSALLADGSLPSEASIGVYAYYHNDTRWAAQENTPNFMFNQQATQQGLGQPMAYSPLKYWPNEEDDKVSFIAYYPYVADGEEATLGLTPQLTATGTGLPTFTMQVKDDVKEQVDFMVSALLPDMPTSRDTEGDPSTPFNDLSITDRVRFVFEHMTAKVEFRITADEEVRRNLSYFTLHSLSLTNLYSEGLLTPTYEAGVGTTFAWSGQSRLHTYPCKTTEAYLLLPQTLRDDAQLVITYDMAFKSEGTTYTYDGSGNPVPTDEYVYRNENASVQLNTLKVGGSEETLTAWLPNHHYVYFIHLGAKRIDFTGQVVGWGEYIWLPMTPEE